jgi:hypothetical protein
LFDLPEDLGWALVVEGRTAAHEKVGDDADGPDVARLPHSACPLAAIIQDLGRDVIWRARNILYTLIIGHLISRARIVEEETDTTSARRDENKGMMESTKLNCAPEIDQAQVRHFIIVVKQKVESREQTAKRREHRA